MLCDLTGKIKTAQTTFQSDTYTPPALSSFGKLRSQEIDSAIIETESANLARIFKASAEKKRLISVPCWLKVTHHVPDLGLLTWGTKWRRF